MQSSRLRLASVQLWGENDWIFQTIVHLILKENLIWDWIAAADLLAPWQALMRFLCGVFFGGLSTFGVLLRCRGNVSRDYSKNRMGILITDHIYANLLIIDNEEMQIYMGIVFCKEYTWQNYTIKKKKHFRNVALQLSSKITNINMTKLLITDSTNANLLIINDKDMQIYINIHLQWYIYIYFFFWMRMFT